MSGFVLECQCQMGLHAFIIASRSKSLRDKKISEILAEFSVKEINTAVFNPAGRTHGIETIRNIIRGIRFKTSSGEKRVVVVKDAQLLTTEAQNAFLKTLEEPPEDTIFILSTESLEPILETVKSRCVVTEVFDQTSSKSQESVEESEKDWERLRGSGIGEKITFAENTGKTREQTTLWVENQIALVHKKIHDGEKNLVTISQALLEALENLKQNTNPKMVLFELLKQY